MTRLSVELRDFSAVKADLGAPDIYVPDLVHQKFTLSLVQITSSKWLQTPAVCRQELGGESRERVARLRPRTCEITIQPLHCHGQTFLCLSETVPIDTAAPVLREVFT